MSDLVGQTRHDEAVARLLASYRAIPAGAPVRLAKSTSNLFRNRARTTVPGLDVSGLRGVVAVDEEAGTADVQGMCTYEDLVDVTLARGLIPLVVPQLRTITLGGAVTGLGIESTSFRSGLPHESVLEMDVLTGDGRVRTVRPGDDLFDAFPNSYGSLGYATRLRIRLERVPGHVALRHVRFTDLDRLTAAVERVVEEAVYDGERVDAVDGVVFAPGEAYLTLARWGLDRLDHPEDRLDHPEDGSTTRKFPPRTTRGSSRTTGRSSVARPTCSRCTTTCGAGTPTGSGARARSASTGRGCGGPGRGGGGAATCSTSSSASRRATG